MLSVPAAGHAGQPRTHAGITPRVLSEVTITARKVVEDAQRVPVTALALRGRALRDAEVSSIGEIGQLAPGLTLRHAPTTASALEMQLRGQLQNDTVATEDPSIGTYVDGVYWARAYGLNANLLDVKEVQVLYGPQGTLFGLNTTGGALVIETNNPKLDTLSGTVSLGAGNYAERNGTLIVNAPLLQHKLAIRAAFNFDDRAGYIRNILDGARLANRRRWMGRVKLLYRIRHGLTTLFSAELFHTRENANPFRLAYSAPPNLASLATATPEIGSLLNLETAIDNGLFIGSTPNVVAASQQIQQYIAGAQGDTVAENSNWPDATDTRTFADTTSLALASSVLRFIAAYRSVAENTAIDLDGSPFNGIEATFHRNLTQWSAELQWTGLALRKRLQYASGVLYFAEHGIDLSNSQSLPALIPTTTVYDGDISNRSIGIYAQGTYRITRALHLTAGLRYSNDQKGLVSHNRTIAAAGAFGPAFPTATQMCNVVPIGAAAFGPTGSPCTLPENLRFSALSYTFGVSYQVAPQAMVYLKTDKGFRSGGENIRGGFFTIGGKPYATIAPFAPEVVRDVEVGVKTQFWNNRARANLDIYHSWNNDIQRTLIVITDQTPDTFVVNAGKQEVSGLESQFTVRALANARNDVLLGLDGSYTDPKYTQYTDPITGANLANSRFEGVPRWAADASLNYRHRLAAKALTLHVDYSWRSQMALQPYNNTADPYNASLIGASTSPAVGFLNARAALHWHHGDIQIALWVRNLMDKRVAVNAVEDGAPLDLVVTQYNAPRMFGATATYRFTQHR